MLMLSGFMPLMAQRPALNSPVIRFTDSNGKPLAGGKLFSFAAGTTTPLATFVDSTTGAHNTNPVILDSTGSATVFLGANVYKLVLQNSAGVVQWTADNIAQGSFQATYVTSYTGRQGTTRTGAVTATTGDLNCADVTGAICSVTPFPTLYYQTVQAGAVSAIQEPILNFIAGVPGSVTNPTLTAAGSGYTGAPTVSFSGGTCTTLPTASANVAVGQIANPVVTAPGSGYTTVPTVSFSGGGGTGATATAVLTGGVVTGLTITNAGSGYTSAPAVTFTGGGGTGAAATVSYLPVGTIASFVLNTQGAGCATPPTIVFSGGGGTGAAGIVSLQPVGISCVDNPGATSTDCTFTVSGGGGGTGGACVLTDVSGSHSVGGTYQNTTNAIMFVSGSLTTAGSRTGGLAIFEGPSSPSNEVFANTSTATVDSGSAGFNASILPGYFYQITNSGAVGGVQHWWEITDCGNTTATTPNKLTGAVTGGAAAGSFFDGSVAITFDFHTVGAIGLAPTFAQTVTQPVNTNFNIVTSGTGLAEANGSQILTPAALAASPYSITMANCNDIEPFGTNGIVVGSTTTNGVISCSQYWSITGKVLRGFNAASQAQTIIFDGATGNGILTQTVVQTHTISSASGFNRSETLATGGANYSIIHPNAAGNTGQVEQCTTSGTICTMNWVTPTGNPFATGVRVTGTDSATTLTNTSDYVFESGQTVLRSFGPDSTHFGGVQAQGLTNNGTTTSFYTCPSTLSGWCQFAQGIDLANSANITYPLCVGGGAGACNYYVDSSGNEVAATSTASAHAVSGTIFIVSGCGTISAAVGGSTAGQFVCTTSSSPIVVTMGGYISPHHFKCTMEDQTQEAASSTAIFIPMVSSTTTTATFDNSTTIAVNGDTLVFACTSY